MAYEPKPMGNRLGIYAEKFEERRRALGLTPSGFREDGTDPAENEKREMERAMYDRADSKVSSVASALGPASASAESTEKQ